MASRSRASGSSTTGSPTLLTAWSITNLWIIAALILFVAIAVIGFAYFTPLVRNQIRLADAGETSSSEFERLSRRNAVIGPLLGVIVLVILGLMVFKPNF